MRASLLLLVAAPPLSALAAQDELTSFDASAPGAQFGLACALGELDGDGLHDVLLGSPYHAAQAGRVDAYGSGTGALLWHLPGETQSQTGRSVVWLGDIDGDGLGELAVGASLHDPPGLTNAGRVRVLSGDGTPQLDVDGTLSIGQFGWDLAAVGDLNGDGENELLVGARKEDHGLGIDQGAAHLIDPRTGASLGLVVGVGSGGRFGQAVAGVGDLDLDGVPDYAVAQSWWNGGGASKRGRVLAYSGATNAALFQVAGAQAGEEFGHSIAGPGDLDGDGAGDLWIGAPYGDWSGGQDSGRGLAVSGATQQVLFQRDGQSSHIDYGTAVSAVGDFDGDGALDVAAAAPYTEGAVGNDRGTVEVLSGLDGAVLASFEGALDNSLYGIGLAGGADTNADGRPELLAAAPGKLEMVAFVGRAHLLTYPQQLLRGSSLALDASVGGSQALSLDVGPTYAGAPYLLVGGASGTQPGFALEGLNVPLNPDAYTTGTLLLANSSLYAQSVGALDAAGQTSGMAIALGGPAPALAGLGVHHAALVFELSPTPKLVLASNPLVLVFH